MDFKANKKTTLMALDAMRKTSFPKERGMSKNNQESWYEHHKQCMSKLTELLL